MNLLMLTKQYPYGTGEAFVENEIGVISGYYDNILIIACEVPRVKKGVRPLPHNVTACAIPAESKGKNALLGAVRLFSNEQNFSAEKKHCKTMPQRLFLGYFEEKAQAIYKKINERCLLKEITNQPYALYSYWLFTTARVGTLIAEKKKPRYMFTRAHRYDLYEDRNPTNYLPYRRFFLETFDGVFPCSNNGTAYLKSRYQDCSENVMTSLLGTLDHGLGKKSTDGVYRIVSCSRVEPVKRVQQIVNALSVIDSENLHIEWTHIGDGSEFDKIKGLASKKLKNVKTVFRGNMKNSDIMELYSSCPFDLFVNVSSSEGLPVSIMEAISFGIPCVATDVGGTSEIVIDGVTGQLIPSDFTAEDLSSILSDFVHGQKYIDRTSCREYWLRNFQAIPNYQRLYDFLRIHENSSIAGGIND